MKESKTLTLSYLYHLAHPPNNELMDNIAHDFVPVTPPSFSFVCPCLYIYIYLPTLYLVSTSIINPRLPLPHHFDEVAFLKSKGRGIK